MAKKKIGYFGGTFDPVHLGHLQMAKELMEKKGLDEVWFSPASRSPFKVDQTPSVANHRIKMLELALEDIPQFHVITLESEGDGPAYTVDTLKKLTANERELYLILSEETAKYFFNWKEPEDILRMATPIIGTREGGEVPKELKKYELKTTITPISSTEIRDRLKKGLDCAEFLPKKVLDYICENHLYYVS